LYRHPCRAEEPRRALAAEDRLYAAAMRFVLIRSPVLDIDTVRTQNIGYDYEQVAVALARLDPKGHSHSEVDGTGLSEVGLAEVKRDVRRAFMHPKKRGRKIGNSFGTNSQPWQDFGTGIPVLLAYDGDRCVDVYPHNESHGTVTITEYLTQATA
jgi:hypothetical protein